VIASLALLVALAAAQSPSTGTAVAVSTPVAAPALRLLPESQLPRFEDSFKSRAGLVKSAKKALKYLQSLPPTRTFKIAERTYATGELVDTVLELLEVLKKEPSPEELDREIRARFDVYQSVGSDGNGKVVFSSYYQPVLPASLKKTDKFRYPIYRRPPDMIEADPADFGKPNGDVWIGRVSKDKKFVPYFDRDKIDVHKALAGKGLEIAWLAGKWDVLDLHIQGSGILKLASGKEVLARYAATNARPYNSAGLTLVKAGVFTREEINTDKIRAYFREHPEAEDWIISQNPRFTFFEITPLPEDGEPFGTTGQSLTAARAIAIDPAVIPLGAVA
jgi:membrane-bound lytic murein transglycosylase A